MQDMIYTFGDANSTWIQVHTQSDPESDTSTWPEADHQAFSIAQLNDTLLARGVPCILAILATGLCDLKVYCEDQRAQTMLLLSIPSGLWCGEPRSGAHIGTGICGRLLEVADASGLKYTKHKSWKLVL